MEIKIIGYSVWHFDVGDSEMKKDSEGKTHIRIDMSQNEMKTLTQKLLNKTSHNIDEEIR